MNEAFGRFGAYRHGFIWALAFAGLYLTSRYRLPRLLNVSP